jgi:5-methyltetrahydropteroyltriglutamate--homocysteine methyltransferase
MTKLLQTTIAGSLPKPAWLAQPKTLWAPWRLEGDALAEGIEDAVRLAVDDQVEAGIDIVTDGEQTRRHFVTTFLEALDGVDFEHRKTVRIRNRYDATCPWWSGQVARRHPVFVDAGALPARHDGAQGEGHAARPDDDGRYPLRRPLPKPREAGVGVRRDPERGGASDRGHGRRRHPVRRARIQRLLRRGARLGSAALERAAQGLACTTAVHICYGYGIKANNDWKQTLGGEWRQYEQTFPLLSRSSIRQVSLECANSHVPIELVGLLEGKDVLVGAIDVATDRVETPEDVAATLRSAGRHVPAERLFPCTNCGMVPLARDVARGKLRALAAGAALVRAEA